MTLVAEQPNPGVEPNAGKPSRKYRQALIHLVGFFHEIFPRFEHSWINTSFFYDGGKTMEILMF